MICIWDYRFKGIWWIVKLSDFPSNIRIICGSWTWDWNFSGSWACHCSFIGAKKLNHEYLCGYKLWIKAENYLFDVIGKKFRLFLSIFFTSYTVKYRYVYICFIFYFHRFKTVWRAYRFPLLCARSKFFFNIKCFAYIKSLSLTSEYYCTSHCHIKMVLRRLDLLWKSRYRHCLFNLMNYNVMRSKIR